MARRGGDAAAAGVAIFKTSNSSEPATAYFMGNAFRRCTFILFCDLLLQRITRLQRRHVPRASYVHTRATKRVYILCGAMRRETSNLANFRLFSPRDFFLPLVRPTNDLSSLFYRVFPALSRCVDTNSPLSSHHVRKFFPQNDFSSEEDVPSIGRWSISADHLAKGSNCIYM